MADRKERFFGYLQSWWDRQLQGAVYPGEWRRGRDAGALASEFQRAAKFEMAQAAFLHRRPSLEEARELVDRLVPAPVEADAELLATAVVRAGATAQKVRISTLAGALLTVGALVLRNIVRGR